MLLRDQVYSDLKRRILDGELAPGETLRLPELAEEFQVSRTPVREALTRLADENYVETFASRWTRVAEIDTGEAERMYPIRWALEAVAIRTSPRFSESQIEAMRTANRQMRKAMKALDWDTTGASDDAFHVSLVAACENPELTKILSEVRHRQLLMRFARIYYAETPNVEKSADEHDEIVDAISDGDNDAAAAAVTAHWLNSLERARAGPTGA